MKLWVLEPRMNRPVEVMHIDPWLRGWGMIHGFVVRAESEAAARELADKNSIDESSDECRVWLDERFSTCEELLAEGEPDVVMRDYEDG